MTGKYSISWLYDDIVNQWSEWLPQSALRTLKEGGYYAVNAFPGLKIISMNTNYCYRLNWWLFVNNTDPAHELEWLVRELQDSENKGEKVHILGHVPPRISNCLRVWINNYWRIISRYEGTVRGQFFAHTHYDELDVVYDIENKTRAVGVAYLGPSATTYGTGHPAYRIYTVDGNYTNSTWTVLDHETYIMNLTEANTHPDEEPEWELEYSAKEAYNMTSLHPEEWDRVLKLMESNDVLFERFYQHYSKYNPLQPECDNTCRKKLLCRQRTSLSPDWSFC